MFVHASGFPYALATFDAPENTVIYDMNDVDALRTVGITRPTDVVTRDRKTTQAWARAIFQRGGFDGVAWWSFYEPAWQIAGLWRHDRIAVSRTPEVLSVFNTDVLEAAAALVRQIS